MYPQKKYSANQESKEIRRQIKRLIKKEFSFSEQVVLNIIWIYQIIYVTSVDKALEVTSLFFT